MRKRIIVAVVLMCLLFASCTNNNTKVREREDIVKEYLTKVYTVNYEGRYEKLVNGKFNEKTFRKYYKCFDSITTEKFSEWMINSRTPLSLEQLYYEQGIEAVPNILSIEEASVKEDYVIYDFELELKDKEAIVVNVSGQVTIDLQENKVSHLYIR